MICGCWMRRVCVLVIVAVSGADFEVDMNRAALVPAGVDGGEMGQAAFIGDLVAA